MIMVNQSRQHSSFDLEDQQSSAGSSKTRPKLNMSDSSISSNKGSDVTGAFQTNANALSEAVEIDETATKKNKVKSIADILKFPSPDQQKPKRANKKKTKSSKTNHKPYFIDKNRDQSSNITEQGFATGMIGEQKNEVVDLASDESGFFDNQYPDEQNSSLNVLNEAPLAYKLQQKTISEKPNYERLENNFLSPLSSFTDVDDIDSDLVPLENLAGNIENENYYKSDFDATQDSTATAAFLNTTKFNNSEYGRASSEPLSTDDDFHHKCYRRINIKKLSGDDVEYLVSSSAVEEDDTPENVGNLSQVSKLKDSLLFKFKSDKLKYQTSPPKRTGQHTLNFLRQTPAKTENNQFLVKIASPKLKHRDIEKIEKEIFASNKYKQANLKNLLTGKAQVSKNSKKDSKLKAPLLKEQIVKLKLPKFFLREVQLRLEAQDFAVKNPFFTAGSKGRVDESDNATSSFFTSVKERSKIADANKTSKKQDAASSMRKLDSLPTRPMVRDEFHVILETETPTLAKRICLSPKHETILDYSQFIAGTLNTKLINEVGNISAQGTFHSFYKYYLAGEFENKVMMKFRNTFENPKFAKFLDNGVFHCSNLESLHLWTERFKPTSIGESLIAEDDSKSIFCWLKDSFLLLEKNYQLKIRQSYIKEKTEGVKKRTRAYNDYDFDDFVVPDFELTDADAAGYNDSLRYDSSISIFDNIKNDAPFVPLMILTGPTGCGKTASIYASTQELNGYVHEINTNQNHSKKALQKTLKELSTSKIVHQKKQKSVANFFSKHLEPSSTSVAAETDFAFQNGIILFENADVLFRNHDKGFWDLLNSILQVTRKPIVLTCSDITMIPNNLVSIAEEQNSLIELSKPDEQDLFLYLKLVASSFRFEVEDSIIQDLIENSNKDLRHCLTNLQFLCEGCADAKTIDTRKFKSKDDEAGVIDITNIDDDENMEALHSPVDDVLHKVITLQYSDNFNVSKRDAWQEQQEKFPKSIVEFSKYVDLLSMADVIETGSKSRLYEVNLVNRIDNFEDQESTDIPGFDKETAVFDIQNDYIYDNYQDSEILIANDEEKTKIVNDDDMEAPRTLNFELNIGMEIKKQYIPTLLMGYRIKFDKYKSSNMGLMEYQDDIVLQQDQDLYDFKVKFLRFPDKRAIVDVFMSFLQLKIRRFLINPRITRLSLNILSNSIFEEADIVKINDLDTINTLGFDTIIVEIGPILRDFARTNINRYKHNEYLKQNSGLTEHQLVHSGILKPLKFELNEAVFAKLFSTLGIAEAPS